MHALNNFVSDVDGVTDLRQLYAAFPASKEKIDDLCSAPRRSKNKAGKKKKQARHARHPSPETSEELDVSLSVPSQLDGGLALEARRRTSPETEAM